MIGWQRSSGRQALIPSAACLHTPIFCTSPGLRPRSPTWALREEGPGGLGTHILEVADLRKPPLQFHNVEGTRLTQVVRMLVHLQRVHSTDLVYLWQVEGPMLVHRQEVRDAVLECLREGRRHPGVPLPRGMEVRRGPPAWRGTEDPTRVRWKAGWTCKTV
jgi:hypothetical protein